MLRNPAYKGRACFGKTEIRPRQRITRPLRQRNGISNRNSANHERPRQDWIEIAVPPLISEEIFALAQEQLEKNKRHSPRRTIEPTLLQGILVCAHCGYGILSDLNADIQAKDLLLPLLRFRCLSTSERCTMRLPPDPPGLSRCGGLDGNHPVAGRSRSDPERIEPPAGSRQKYGSTSTTN